ncbi:VOC family protein [Adlercreutzia sp. ZJ304]|uniref:VOC family protein n=1 Tax=Adlercreutzia sp. ZJ304 TaxID=2709791 RepID=UPI0013E9FC24|nr:VOC family protein [Adlercreutzia sp. ZJ304]
MANHITEIKQLGFVTRDIEKAIENFTKVGLTDWSPVTKVSNEEFTGMICDGEKQDYAFLCATDSELDIEIELIQPLDDHSDYAHWLDKLDTWISLHHISVSTDDEDDLRNSGHKLLLAGYQKGIPFEWEYYDFRDDIGTVLEYFPMPVEE